jgi:negative regulator of flagellin synthesis FlgM
MKIGTSPDNSIQVHTGSVAVPQKPAQGNTAAVAQSASQSTRSVGVAVTVSTLARGLEKTGRADTADINSQKVASVRAAIEQGTFVVNPEAIADKLLSNAQEMLDRSSL